MIKKIILTAILVNALFINAQICQAIVSVGNASATVYFNTNPADNNGFSYAAAYNTDGVGKIFKVKLPDQPQAYTIGQEGGFLLGWTASQDAITNTITVISPDNYKYIYPQSTGYKLSVIKNVNNADIATFEYTNGLLTKQRDGFESDFYIEYDYGQYGNITCLETITLNDNLNNATRQYSIICDINNGNVVEILNSCGCGGGSRYEYDANNLLRYVKDANDDIVYEYIYDANGKMTDKYLGSAGSNNHIQQFVYTDTNDSNFIVDTYDYLDSSNFRVTREYKNPNGRTLKKIQYEEINEDPNNPTGEKFYEHTVYFFNATGLVTKKVVLNSNDGNSPDPNSLSGIRKEYTYDPNTSKLLSEKWYAADDSNFFVNQYAYEYVYDGNAFVDTRILTYTDIRGGTTRYYYNGDSLKPYRKVMPDVNSPVSPTIKRLKYDYTYDNQNRISLEKQLDEANNIIVQTKYDYDDFGNAIKRWDNYGDTNDVTEYQYNGFNEIIREKSPAGILKGYSYNADGKKEYEVVYDPCDTDYVYSQTRYYYDYKGRVNKIAVAKDDNTFLLGSPNDWIYTEYEYDQLGNKTKEVKDVNGVELQTTYEYNNQSELIKITEPSGRWTKTIRDGRGLVVQNIIGYDTHDILITDYEYDSNKNLIRQANSDGTVELFEYDDFNRLIKRQKLNTNGPYSVYEYDNFGNITRETSFDVNDVMLSDIRTEYNVLGRVWRQKVLALPDYPDNTNDRIILYQYNSKGNVIRTIQKGYGSTDSNDPNEPNDVKNTTIYDKLARTITTIDGTGSQISFTYDKDGKIFTTTDPNGFVTTNYYDHAGRLQKVKNPEGHYKLYYYDSLGRNTKEITYDCNGTPENSNDDFALEQLWIEYDGIGNITRKAAIKNPASFAAINTSLDMVRDYVYDDTTGLLYQEIDYYNNGSTQLTYHYYDGIARPTIIQKAGISSICNYYDLNTGQIYRIDQIHYGNGEYTVRKFFAYDDYGRLHTSTIDDNNSPDFNDLTTTFYYDDLNRKKKEISADGIATVFEYDTFNNLVKKVEDPNSQSEPDNLNRITEYAYDRLGRQIAIKGYDGNNPNGQITTYKYDKANQITKITYSDGNSIQYAYNLLGKVDTEIHQDGTHIYYGYDKLGNCTFESDDPNGNPQADGFLVEFEYDGANRIVWTSKIADGQTVSETQFTYNGFGLKTSEKQTLHNLAPVTIYYEYDNAGNVITQTRDDESLHFAYNGIGKISYIRKNDANIIEYTYLGTNAKTVEYPQADIINQRSFDEIGRITQCSSANDSNTFLDLQYTYDDASNRTSVKYNHLATPVWDKYTYDRLQRIIKAEYGSDSGISAFLNEKYDIYLAAQIGLLWIENKLTANAETIGNHSSKTSNLQSSIFNLKDMPVVAFSEMADGNEPAEETTTEILKDDNDNTIAKIVYDSSSRIIEFTMYPDVGGWITVATAYDLSGNIVTNTANTYDANGLLVSTEDLTISTANEQTENTISVAPALPVESFSEELYSLEGGAGGMSMMMSMGSQPQGQENYTEDYILDLLGNRLNYLLYDGDVNYTYYHNSLNQYSRIHHNLYNMITEDANYFYDNKGNLQSEDYYQYEFEYDYRNRLTKATLLDHTIAEFTYDALGRRISKTVDGQSTYYYYDTMGRVIAEYQGIAESNEVSLVRTFVYGNGIDEVLAMFNPEEEEVVYDPNGALQLADFCESWLCDINDGCFNSQYDYDDSNMINFKDFTAFASNWTGSLYLPPANESETRWYYLHDTLGSVMAVIGSRYNRESDREFYLYDVYGRPQGSEQSPSNNPYGFASYRYDNEIGLYYLRARYYDAGLGRFTGIDPLGVVPNAIQPNYFYPVGQYTDGLNLYEYANSEPVMSTDPYGLKPYCCKIKTTNTVPCAMCGGQGMPYTKKETTCTQNTIYSECKTPEVACCAAYQGQKNVSVYEAHSGECCSCTITMRHSLFYYPTSHRVVTIKCTDGLERTIDLSPFHHGDLGNVRIREREETWRDLQWPSGSIQTSCKKASNVLSTLTSVDWGLCAGGNTENCITFAHKLFNKFKGCP